MQDEKAKPGATPPRRRKYIAILIFILLLLGIGLAFALIDILFSF